MAPHERSWMSLGHTEAASNIGSATFAKCIVAYMCVRRKPAGSPSTADLAEEQVLIDGLGHEARDPKSTTRQHTHNTWRGMATFIEGNEHPDM